MLLTSFLTVAIGAVSVIAQSATSTYVEPDVPTGTPVVGNYDGPLRPQIHFSPPTGFMNDPNGMFKDAEGVYHLYYQCMQPIGLILVMVVQYCSDCRRQPYRSCCREPTLGPRYKPRSLPLGEPTNCYLPG